MLRRTVQNLKQSALHALIQQIKPNLLEEKMEFIHEIALPGHSGPFQNLGPARDYQQQISHVSVEGVPLPRPLAQCIERDTSPLPHTDDREGYCGERHFEYWLMGLRDYSTIRATLAQHGQPLSAGTRVLELGAASGRVLRHFRAQEDGLDLWGCDINRRHAEWMRKFLPSDLRVFQNSVYPALPLEDRSFDLVYAFSVFTHIDHFELAWLLELRRILRPGGYAYLSLHTDHTWKNFNPKMHLYNVLLANKHGWREHFTDETMLAAPMPGERVVLTDRTTQTYNCNIFHDTAYLRDTWGRYFEIVDILREAAGYQDAIVLRKPQ